MSQPQLNNYQLCVPLMYCISLSLKFTIYALGITWRLLLDDIVYVHCSAHCLTQRNHSVILLFIFLFQIHTGIRKLKTDVDFAFNLQPFRILSSKGTMNLSLKSDPERSQFSHPDSQLLLLWSPFRCKASHRGLQLLCLSVCCWWPPLGGQTHLEARSMRSKVMQCTGVSPQDKQPGRGRRERILVMWCHQWKLTRIELSRLVMETPWLWNLEGTPL